MLSVTLLLGPDGPCGLQERESIDSWSPDPSVPMVVSWKDVDSDLVVLLRPGDVLVDGAIDIIRSAFGDPSIVLACCVGLANDREATSGRDGPIPDTGKTAVTHASLPGPELSARWVGDLSDPRIVGPVAVRMSAADSEPPTDKGYLKWLLAVLRRGSAAAFDAPLLAAVPASPRPERWLEPREVIHWLEFFDECFDGNTTTHQQETDGTIKLLRRAVLLPDLSLGGPDVELGILVVEQVAARLDHLLAGTPVRRHEATGFTLIPVGISASDLAPSNWWKDMEAHPEPLSEVGQSILLVGSGVSADEMERFLPPEKSPG
jgi:hypothetical protein